MNDLAIESTKATTTTRNKMNTLLDYLATNPITAMSYRKSDMMLKTHSFGSCLSVINTRIITAGHFCFGDNKHGNPNQIEHDQGSMHQEFRVIKPIVASAAEYETATLFVNCQTEIVIRTNAMELGHQQLETHIQVENTTT